MNWVSSVLASLLALAALSAPAAEAAAGDLDPSFGVGGSERFLHSHAEIGLTAIATQPDGKVVLAGIESPENLLVVRLLENGSFDPGFGTGGMASIPFAPNGLGEVRAVTIQPDGKIVVAGSGKGTSNEDFLIVRCTSDGSPDPSFGGGDGIEIIPVGADRDVAQAVAMGQGGRILVTGLATAVAPPGVEVGIVVLGSDGKQDPSFEGGGIKLLETTGEERDDEGVAIAEQPDGKIVVADESGNGRGNGFTLVRMLPGGALDPFFGVGGIATTPIPGNTAPQSAGRVLDLALLSDGRIVASGYGYDEVGPSKQLDQKFAAVRYLASGIPDPSFGGAGTGIFSQQIGESFDERAQVVAVTPAGKAVLSGPYVASSDGIAIMRLDSSGVLDPTFGKAGLVIGSGGQYHDAALDSQERLVVVSTAFEEGMTTSVEVTRFLGDEPQPPKPPDKPLELLSPPQYTPAPIPKPPHARMKAVPRKLQAAKLTGFSGTAADPDGSTIAKVQIALVQASTAKAGSAATCLELKNAKGQFKTVKAKRGNCPLLWLQAKGTAKWSFKLKTVLPPGRYVVYSRAVEASGLAEETFSRAAGNRFAFRLLAPPAPSIRNP